LNRSKAFLLLAFMCAALAAGAAAWLLHVSLPQKTVLVAAADIGPRGQIPASAVRKVSLPAAGVPDDALVDEASLSGKVARGFIPAGTVLREAMLQPRWSAGAAGALAEIGPEYRLVALPVSLDTSVGNCVAAGDRIDLYAVGRDGRHALVASNVLVFSGPGLPSKPPAKGLGILSGQQDQQKPPDALVLVLHESEVDRVVAALAESSRLIAVLRPLEGESGGLKQ